MSFRLATVLSSNPLKFVNVHCYERVSGVRMHIDKVNWITAHNYGKPKWHSFSPSLSCKGKFWVSTLSPIMCPRKQTCWLDLSRPHHRRDVWWLLLHNCLPNFSVYLSVLWLWSVSRCSSCYSPLLHSLSISLVVFLGDGLHVDQAVLELGVTNWRRNSNVVLLNQFFTLISKMWGKKAVSVQGTQEDRFWANFGPFWPKIENCLVWD